MINLMVKDIVSQLKYLFFILALFVFFSFVGGFGHIYLSVGLLMLAMRLGYLEDKNNALLFLRTMPLKSSTIVLSKYFSVLLITIFFGLLGLGKLYLFQELDLDNFLSLVVTLSMMLLFAGGFFILHFKLGYMKATTYFRVIFLSVFALFFAGASKLKEFKPALEEFFQWLPLKWYTFIGVELLILVIYFLLSAIAVYFFRNQEVYS